ncbi:flagellar biosynthesis protein FliQ [bacterium]|nr:flagellar biosynthesis protein FliQ [bacterium]
MNTDFVINLMNESMTTAATVGLPILLTTLFIGVIISLFQAVTQIQEMTLTFVPKLLLTGVVMYLLGPWMLNRLTTFSDYIFSHLLLVK